MNKSYFKFIISIVVGSGLLLLTLSYFDLEKTFSAINEANPSKLILAFALLVAAYLMRGRRWIVWEPDLTFWNSFKFILVGYMGNNVLPARLGELLRAHCASANISNTFGRTATLASIAIERILDGLVIAIIGLIGMTVVVLQAELFWALAFVCALFLSLTTALILGIYFHLGIRRLFDWLHNWFPGHLTRFGREKINYFLDGLQLLRRPKVMLAALLMTGLVWGIELLSYYLVATAVVPDTAFMASLIFLSVANFSSLFPFTVGGIGAIEGGTVPYLISLGIPPNESLAMILIQHGFLFFFQTSVGVFFYFGNKYYKIPIFGQPSSALKEKE